MSDMGYTHGIVQDLRCVISDLKDENKELQERIQKLESLVYAAYELGIDDEIMCHGYKDAKQVFAALTETNNGS